MDANPGDLVECINAQPSSDQHAPPPFIKGQIYKVEACGLTRGNKRPAYKLEGIPEFWTKTRFRKLPGEKKKADEWISNMLKLGGKQPDGTPVKTPEFEDA